MGWVKRRREEGPRVCVSLTAPEDLTHLQSTFHTETKITQTVTPYAIYKGPLSPSWRSDLAKCKSEEDLFALVMPIGFINPDALNEVRARKLYRKYCEWKRKQAEHNKPN
jgi:hypothetical protein